MSSVLPGYLNVQSFEPPSTWIVSPVIQRASRMRGMHYTGDVVRFGHTLQRLHAQRDVAALRPLGEVRHVGLDDAGRHGVDADASLPELRREVLDQRVNRALGGGIGRKRADAPPRRQGRGRITLLPSPRMGRSCCTRKNGARTFTANSRSKSSIVVSAMAADLEMPAFATRISRRPPTMSRTCFRQLCGPSLAAISASAPRRGRRPRISATTSSASALPRP